SDWQISSATFENVSEEKGLFHSEITWKRSFAFITPHREIQSGWVVTFILQPIWIRSWGNFSPGSLHNGQQSLPPSPSWNWARAKVCSRATSLNSAGSLT